MPLLVNSRHFQPELVLETQRVGSTCPVIRGRVDNGRRYLLGSFVDGKNSKGVGPTRDGSSAIGFQEGMSEVEHVSGGFGVGALVSVGFKVCRDCTRFSRQDVECRSTGIKRANLSKKSGA